MRFLISTMVIVLAIATPSLAQPQQAPASKVFRDICLKVVMSQDYEGMTVNANRMGIVRTPDPNFVGERWAGQGYQFEIKRHVMQRVYFSCLIVAPAPMTPAALDSAIASLLDANWASGIDPYQRRVWTHRGRSPDQGDPKAKVRIVIAAEGNGAAALISLRPSLD